MESNCGNQAKWSIFFVEIFIGATIFGVFLTLENYLTQYSSFNDARAINLWTQFAGFVYIVPFISGWIGGRYIPYLTCCMIGCPLAIVGCFIIVFNPSLIIFGLALLACGNGMLGPNLRILLGKINSTSRWDHYRKYIGFQGATVWGQLIGPFLLSTFANFSGRYVFLIAGIFQIIAFIIFIRMYSTIKAAAPVSEEECNFNISPANVLLITTIVLVFLSILIFKFDYLIASLLLVGIFFIYKLFDIVKKSDHENRIRIFTIVSFMFGMLVFATCTKQEMSVVQLFAQNYVDHSIGETVFPVNYLFLLDPLVYIVFAFLFRYIEKFAINRGITPHIPTFFCASMCLLFLAHSIIWLGTTPENVVDKVHTGYMVTYIFLMGLSGFFILPTISAVCYELAPQNWRGLFMGMILFSISAAAFVNRFIITYILKGKQTFSLDDYHFLFGHMAIGLGIVAILLSMFWFVWWKKNQQYLPT